MKKITTLIITIIILGIVSTKFDKQVYAYEYITEDTCSINNDLQTSSDESPSNVYYDSFVQAYFENLTTNFGVNYKGSCGYVALAMLLSYYDTYLNDEIIPEQYDVVSLGSGTNMISRRNSPGVLKDTISNALTMSATDYYSAIETLSNLSLHAKLITIGETLNYYNFSSDDNPCGTNFSKRVNILKKYFGTIVNYTSSDYTLEYMNYETNPSRSADVRNFTIEKVKQGIPVLLSVGNDTSSGHVIVAYDYDEITDKLYCHYGWHNFTTYSTPESQGYTIYKTALTINFTVEHEHSNNYGVTNNDSVTYYCYDDPHIVTYREHTHNYVNHYCTICNAYTTSHDYNTYTWVNDRMHTMTCSCGLITNSAHVVSSSSSIPWKEYSRCLQCGGRAKVGYIYINPLSIVSEYYRDGQYVLENGVIIIFDNN